jgi:hypothetical protein
VALTASDAQEACLLDQLPRLYPSIAAKLPHIIPVLVMVMSIGGKYACKLVPAGCRSTYNAAWAYCRWKTVTGFETMHAVSRSSTLMPLDDLLFGN